MQFQVSCNPLYTEMHGVLYVAHAGRLSVMRDESVLGHAWWVLYTTLSM